MCCIIYVRVSTDEQARHGHSLAAQEEDCRSRAAAFGYTDADIVVIREEGVSGEAVDRPGLNRLRDLVAVGSVRHVIMSDPDRFARNLSLQLIVTDEILRRGAALEFVNFEWRDTPEGRLFYSLRGAIAEYEKAKIKERTRRGRERMLKEGKLPADPRLYGYRWNRTVGQFETHPAEFPVLLWIQELALAGESTYAIARRLTKLGVSPPRGIQWHPSTVWKLLHNRDYTGTYYSGKRGGTRRSFPLPPAWDEATADRLAAAAGTRRGAPQRSPALLAGLLHCGTCSGRPRMALRASGGYRYYACGGRGRGNGQACAAGYWPAEPLETAVWQALLRAMAGGLSPSAEPGPAAAAARSVLRQALSESRRREQRLLRLYLDGRLTETAYERERAVLLAHRKAARRALAGGCETSRTLPTPAPSHLADGEKRLIVRTLVRRLTLRAGEPLRMEVILAPDFADSGIVVE